MRTRAGIFFVLAAALAACGGTTSTESTDAGGGGAAGAGGGAGAAGAGGSAGSAGGSGGAGGGGATVCPPTPPQGPCAVDGLRCTYGDSVRPECRQVATCTGGQWLAPASGCNEPPPGACGIAPPPTGTVCSQEALVCSFSDATICLCTSCTAGPCAPPPPRWKCAGPPGNGCPAVAPNDGTACSQEALACTYGDPCGPSGAHVVCTAGAWRWDQNIACAQ